MTQPSVPAGQIPSLDGIRAVSIVIVFLAHAGVSDLIPGGFGVTIFFFLSGYLITTLLTREIDRYGEISLRNFFLRRLIRLAPPLLLTIALAVLACALGLIGGKISVPTLISQVFFFYNYFAIFVDDANIKGFSILWSLSVEEHFYLVWPFIFIAYVTGRLGMIHLVGLLAAILVWRAVRLLVIGSSPWEIYLLTDTRFDSLLYGCVLALMDWRGISARIFPRGPWLYIVLAGALAVLAISFLYRDPVFRATLRYSLQGLALMPLFYYAVHRSDLVVFRPLDWAPVRRLGIWSYTIYLAHFVIIRGLELHDIAAPGTLAMVLIAGGASVAYGAAVYAWVERPLYPLRRRLTAHRPSRTGAVAAQE